MSTRLPHFPLPSVQVDVDKNPHKTSDRLKGKVYSSVFEGQGSLASIFSSSLFRRDFSCNTCAIIQNGQMGLTFQQLDDMARRVARILTSKIALIIPGQKEAPVNLDGDSVVGIAVEDHNVDERLIVFLLAILKLGATYLSFRPSQMNELEWKRMLQQAQPLIIITAGDEIMPNTTELLPVTRNGKVTARLPHQIWSLQDIWNAAIQLTYQDSSDMSVTPLWSKKPTGDRTAGIFPCEMASGKGLNWIRIGNRAILNRIHWEKTEFPVQASETCYLTYPLVDPRSVCQIFLPLCSGKSLSLLEPAFLKYPSYLLSQIFEAKLFRLNLSSKELDKLLDVAENNQKEVYLASVRFWMVSGDVFPFHVGRKFFRVFPKDVKKLLVVFYGSPEVLWAATWCAFPNLKEFKKYSEHGKICVGVPLHNTMIHIIDDKNCADCPLGAKGEICISGGTVAVGGYSGQGLKDKASVVFQTGDLGRIILDKSGAKLLIVEGRTSSRIKYDGSVIDFDELAQAIINDKLARDCTVFSAPRAKDVQAIVVAYVPLPEDPNNPDANKCASDIFEAIRAFEPLIAACIPVAEMPTLSDGQIDFRGLRREYHKFLTSGCPTSWLSLKAYSKDKRQAARVLCKSVASSLGIQVQFVCENFMRSFWSLGGTPTKAVRTMLAVEAQGFNLTAEDFALSGRLDHLLDRMVLAHKYDPIWAKSVSEVKGKFQYEEFAVKHKKEVLKLLKKDYDFKVPGQPVRLDRYWMQAMDEIVYNNLSVVASLDEQIIGIGLNCKLYPKIKGIPAEMAQVLTFFESVIDACKSEISTNVVGKMARSYYFALDESMLTPAQQILVARDLLHHSFQNCRRSGCDSFLLCTTNPLFQEVAACILHYKTLCELPLNRYKTKDLIQPFWDKDDHCKVAVYIKTKPVVNAGNVSNNNSKSGLLKDSSRSNFKS